MTASSGKHPQHPAGEALQPDVVLPAPVPRPGAKASYRKPELKRLGRLRSVTGSDLKW